LEASGWSGPHSVQWSTTGKLPNGWSIRICDLDRPSWSTEHEGRLRAELSGETRRWKVEVGRLDTISISTAPHIVRLEPNPARTSTQVVFQALRPGTARIELFDVAGRRAHQQNVEVATGGSIEVELALPASLSAGSYFVRVLGSGYAARGSLQIVR
jgi:hypothetical protein